MKLSDILDKMRDGAAVLRLSLADKPTWKLHSGTDEKTVSSRSVQAAIKRGAIIGADDTLFADTPSQTWIYTEPPSGDDHGSHHE